MSSWLTVVQTWDGVHGSAVIKVGQGTSQPLSGTSEICEGSPWCQSGLGSRCESSTLPCFVTVGTARGIGFTV